MIYPKAQDENIPENIGVQEANLVILLPSSDSYNSWDMDRHI